MANKQKKFQLFFAEDQTVPLFEPGFIIITPNNSHWNDFGHVVKIDIRINLFEETPDGPYLLIKGYFGLVEEMNGLRDIRPIRDMIRSSNEVLLSSDNLPEYFTMLPDMESYRRIVQSLGSTDARLALSEMNDLVEESTRKPQDAWYRKATNTKIFLEAFLRQSESFFAWRNAASILDGIDKEQISRMSSGIQVRFKLAGRPNEHDLRFKFSNQDTILPQRFAVVIGKNGVGKSQALGNIVKAALRGKSNLTDLNGERPELNRIIGFYTSYANSSVFPSEKNNKAHVWYRRFALTGGRSQQKTSDLIVQLARSTEMIGGQKRYDIFLQTIKAIDGSSELVLKTKSGEGEPVPFSSLNRGGEQRRIQRYASINLRSEPARIIDGSVYPLSSGELAFLRFSALASLYVENGTLLLLDEPENHLHPNFIGQFAVLLDTVLSLTGSAAIISTHSVYFVREVTEDQVIILSSDRDRFIHAEQPTLKTFGADVGAISFFVFGEDQPSRMAHHVELKMREGGLAWNDIYKMYKSKISLELLGDIRAQIEGKDGEEGAK